MSTTLYLVRHGDAVKPRDLRGRPLVYGPQARLSHLGIDQMRDLARTFNNTGVELGHIYSSTTTRSKISAAILSGELTCPPRISWAAGLRASNMPEMYFKPEEDFANIQSIYDLPSTEPIEVANNRVQRAVSRILRYNAGRTIAIVTHSEQIALLDGNWRSNGLPVMGRELDNGTALRWVLDNKNEIKESQLIVPAIQNKERSY